MAWIYADRVLDRSVSTGTGNMVVSGSAPITWRTFSAVCAISDTFYYTIVDPVTGAWESGEGTYSALNTITRTTFRASSTGTTVSFAANTKDVFIDVIGYYFSTLDTNLTIAAGAVAYGDTTGATGITGDLTNFSWDATNKELGIGTSTPAAALHVRGVGQNTPSVNTGSATGAAIWVQDSTTGVVGHGGMVMFGAGAGAFAAVKGHVLSNTANTTGDLTISTRRGTASTTLTETARFLSTGGTTLAGDLNVNGLASFGAAVPTDGNSLLIAPPPFGASGNPEVVSVTGTIASGHVGSFITYYANCIYPAVTMTATAYYGFRAEMGTKPAGVTLGSINGFYAGASLVGATSVRGFHSVIPAGTGQWNVYAAGTAANAFAGSTRFGSVVAPTATVDVTGTVTVSGTLTGAAASFSGAVTPTPTKTVALGSASLVWSALHTVTNVHYGATSGTSTLQAPAVAGTTTITLPSATGTLALLAQTIQLHWSAGSSNLPTAYGPWGWDVTGENTTGGSYTSSSGLFTIPTGLGGLWDVAFAMQLSGSGTVGLMALRVNSTDVATTASPATNSNGVTMTLNGKFRFAAGDVISSRVMGTATTVGYGTTGSTRLAWLHLTRIAP